jgi:Family of unknown function (DUF6629)
MCFSAPASFIVSGGLSIIGLLSICSAKTKAQYPLAMTSFFFAIQQASEGIVWLTINNPAYQLLNTISMMVFLIFAMTFWPVWIPYALFNVEKYALRKKILAGLYTCGALVAAYSYYRLFFFSVHVKIFDGSLLYFVQYKRVLSPDLYLLIYFIPTVVSFFVSSFSLMWLFGFIVTGSLFLSYFAWYATYISVWCFFAAVLSTLILISLRMQNK